MTTPNTFLGLLDNYNVEIPILQRDYAQGREEQEDLRENFVKDLICSIKENKPLELDFIYGPVNDDIFAPLDGQQRLTTLFLLHWYLIPKDDLDFVKLRKFKYKVRVTTQEFLDALLDSDKGGKIDLKKKPKHEILDASWYYSIWDYDPTIQGMLNMLDTINEELQNQFTSQLWKNLKKESPITFYLLIMNGFGLGDELYMRMNARGIPLTPFENFKAWLQGNTEALKKPLNAKWLVEKSGWLCELDKKWTDLLWSYSKSNEANKDKLFDQYYLRFFKGMAQFAIANNFNKDDKKEKKSKEEMWIEKLTATEKLIPLSQYKDMECFNKQCLEDSFEILNFISKKENNEILKGFYFEDEKNKDLFSNFIKEQTYKDKVLFYALIQYLKKNDWNIKEETFNQYKRVIRNLVANTDIDNANFINAIQSINKLSENANNILETIEVDSYEILFFNKEQVAEEKLKAKLMLATNQKDWFKLIVEVENHPLFRGQISFLLKKIDDNENLLKLDCKDYEYFKRNCELANKIWSNTGSNNFQLENKQLVIRALLCMNFSLWNDLNLSNSKDSWKTLFRNNHFNASILKLFTKINISSIEGDLKKIIKEYPDSDFQLKDCRSSLIKNDFILAKFSHIWKWNKDYFEVRTFRTARADYNRYFLFPMRDIFYEKIKEKLNHQFNIDDIENNKEWGALEIQIGDSITIALQKGVFSENITIGILNTKNENLNEKIKKQLDRYSNTNYSWACFREDEWNENKSNPQKYVEELKELCTKLQSICSTS